MFYSLVSNWDGIFNLFRYITFRTGAALLTSLFIYLLFGGAFIRFISERFRQPIREEGPETHLRKRGTPTMGGVLIIAAIFASAMLWCNLSSGYVWIALSTMLSFGLIGFIDDYMKVVKGNAYRGLSARIRLSLQFAISAAVCYGIYTMMPNEFKTVVAVPFFKNVLWDIGIFYFIFVAFVIVGTANAVNLTDGIDGLASITSASSFLVFLLVSYLIGRADYSLYLFMPYVPGAGELTVLIGAIIGAILGFLWFNAYPAKIFMGDVGSLAIGSMLGVASVITKNELLLLITGAIFAAEAISVMLQVASMKLRGKRIFKMAPIHHHFELLGWSEQTVVIRFWIISIILALIALSSIKVR
ncbi:MAG: phospho-N-acetylmuramoyl-pentapeptide-transferase [Rickettsiales bacterium]|jgi:phospho-N-acetylmuramoyl-pentapeptide-transferase|nr:phospho-N-acetylmuramoyl-pentapeptide-transferase [Rickettsiales bacterium]